MTALFHTGDLCRMTDHVKSGIMFVAADEDFITSLLEADQDTLFMVTGSMPESHLKRLLGKLREASGVPRSADCNQVLQVLVSSGSRAGSLGYVPNFWLQVVVPCPGAR